MDGKPHCFLIRVCPFHAVPLVAVNADVVAGFQRQDVFLSLEAQAGAPLEQNDPFVVILIIPEPLG